MELWFTEKQTENFGITAKVSRTLHTERTPYQRIDVLETVEYGRMLVLDGMVMCTDRDEFIYHEMIAHVPLFTHPDPKQVLVIGGGDGGTIREVVKHPRVERAVLAEIDERVIAVSKEYFPALSRGFADPRVEIEVGDGIAHVKANKDTYDVILVDSTEPIGPAEGLFAREFYEGIYEALRPGGVFVAQTESPLFNAALISRVWRDIASIYPVTRLYLAPVPTYPTGMWSFTLGSKGPDPLQAEGQDDTAIDTRYYTPEVHRASFALPRFVEELLAR
ncbi:polyamine aminopropyltransferase [Kyrpidia sp.]|uniref:polyamine aminopropyltransferase n=1 Tax=Kyrpidia sp. TaxID=2073077 RepID=UPI00258C4422|nr:polyamine aminopropyltransferase [Kyrpidia sp.]MCL6576574.1 polyamine aminopropyltransferase [Kyrpidia sp.]